MRANRAFLRALVCAIALVGADPGGGVIAATRSLGEDYEVRVWNTRDGLPQNSINQIVQTRDGYLWLATFGGLARFDGVRFAVFDMSSSEGLASNRILALHEDREGNLWIGHESGEVSRLRDGAFRSFGRVGGPSSTRAAAFAEDEDGRIWVATSDGLVRFAEGRFRHLVDDDVRLGQRISRLLVDPAGDLWLGSDRWDWGAALARLRGSDYASFSWRPEIRAFCAKDEPECGLLHITSLAKSRYGGFWAGTLRRLLYVRDESFTERHVLSGATPSGRGVRAVVETRSGGVWFNTREGIGVLAPEDAASPTGEPVIYETGLSTEILSLFEDREGNVWAGTDGQGLVRIRSTPVRRLTVADGLPSRRVQVVTTDGAGGLWIGAGCNTLTHYRDRRFTVQRPGPSFGCVGALLLDRAGDLWLGRNNLLSRLSGGRFVHYPADTADGFILSIFEDREGRIWVGADRGGVLQLVDKRIVHRLSTANGLLDDHVAFITQDREGALWFGTARGLSRWADGAITNYTEADGLAPGLVRSIHEDADGGLWIGTYGGGLARLRGGRFDRIDTDDGLADNVISRILEDEDGNLWMLGNLSLFYASRQQLDDFTAGRIDRIDCVSFGPEAGMPEGNGGGQPAGWRDANGRLWLPTIDGLATIDGDDPPLNTVPPTVLIESLLANGRRTEVLPGGDEIRVPPGDGDLEIHYTATTFAEPESARFRYRLLGNSENWDRAGGRRVAYYTNLAPGSYRFEVEAANNDGVWSPEAAVLPLVIEPHFWETSWFIFAGLLLAGVLGAGSVELWTRRMRAHNLRLQMEVDERRRAEAERERVIAELETRGAELERFTYTVSHDLKAPLITIRAFGDLLAKDLQSGNFDRAGDNLSRIREASEKMQRLLEDLLELARVGHLLGETEVVEPTRTAREAAGLADARLNGVELIIMDDMPPVKGDPARLVEVFQNLIENAAKFMGKQESPRIEVAARRDGDQIVLEVRDNGIGIDPLYFDKIFELFERLPMEVDRDGTGIGLALAKRIVEGHGGSIWVESEGDGTGSVFLFTLPAA